jgi:AbrB family looped-hinge helix DNA binding protein
MVSYPLPMSKEVKKAGRSRVSSKHQITIPAAAFRGAGLREGDVLKIEAQGSGRLVLTKLEDVLDRYSGCLATGGSLRQRVEELRDEWR